MRVCLLGSLCLFGMGLVSCMFVRVFLCLYVCACVCMRVCVPGRGGGGRFGAAAAPVTPACPKRHPVAWPPRHVLPAPVCKPTSPSSQELAVPAPVALTEAAHPLLH